MVKGVSFCGRPRHFLRYYVTVDEAIRNQFWMCDLSGWGMTSHFLTNFVAERVMELLTLLGIMVQFKTKSVEI